MKKLLSLLVAAVMVIGLLPAAILAAPAKAPSQVDRPPAAEKSATSIGWDFETDPAAQGFQMIDRDGDNYNWFWHVNTGTDDYTTHGGNGLIASESNARNNGTSTALTPDNWLITPAFSGTGLTFWMVAQDEAFCENYVGVYVSTDGGETWSDEVLGEYTAASYTRYTVNLRNYEGQTVNVAFRHYNSNGEYVAAIDDIEVLTGEMPEAPIVGYYFENQELADKWTFVDADGDGANWHYYYNYQTAYEGRSMITSASYHIGIPLHPDNWAISPEVEIPAGGGSVSMYLRAQDPNYSAEHYAIYVGTGSDVSTYTALSDEFVATRSYVRHAFDLSAYAGQTVRVAVRHFNCTDMSMLNLDKVEFWGEDVELPVEPEYIDTVELLDFTAPAWGEAPSYELSVPEGANYYISEVRWRYRYQGVTTDMSDGMLFDNESYEYFAMITFTPNEGYQFDTRASTEFTATINGSEELVSRISLVNTQTFRIISSAFTVAPPSAPILGDVNGNGVVTVEDALLLMRCVMEIDTNHEMNLEVCDVNGDGSITLEDALLLMRRVMEIGTK